MKSFIRRQASKIRKAPKKSLFMANNRVYSQYDIGEWSFGRPNVRSWMPGSSLRIGKYCSISDSAFIMLDSGNNHLIDAATTYPLYIMSEGFDAVKIGSPSSVEIGHDVMVATQAMILPGVKIGHGAIVAARAVVTTDVPPYAVVAGNPAKIIKYRFGQDGIDRLLKLAWWDWPEQIVLQYKDRLCRKLDDETLAFLEKVGSELELP